MHFTIHREGAELASEGSIPGLLADRLGLRAARAVSRPNLKVLAEFVRAELKEHDPALYEILRKVWSR